MGKPFKIFIAAILLSLYYATIPSITFVFLGNNAALKNTVLAGIIGWLVLLAPIILIAVFAYLKKHR